MVSQRGIKANSEKTKAIMDMQLPSTIKVVQRQTDKVATLNQFMSRFTDYCLPFFRMLRKINNFEWTTKYQ